MPHTAIRLMTLLGVTGCLAAVVIWLVPTAAPPPTVPPPMLPPLRLPAVPLPLGTDQASVVLRGALLNGERIYQRLCFHCHGRQGKGDNNAYMESVGHKPADHTNLRAMQRLPDTDFFIALRDGVKDKRGWFTMPPWASVLTPTEMWDVITYVRHLPLVEASEAPSP